MKHALESFLECLRQQRYYEAHEVLEVQWFPRRFEDCDEVRLLKGLINASVSFELIKRGRPEPSQRAWQTYVKYRALLHNIEGSLTPLYRRVARQVERIHAAAPIMI